ncbi:MAG: hypothetical protein QOJ16_2574 [Acidobacteriota bacterium]|nr:hypothetical protein [Acidobacteriota bacterium]
MASEPLPLAPPFAEPAPERPVLVPGSGRVPAPVLADKLAYKEVLFAALLALVLTGALFFVQRRIDWNPSDEGFLWYGAVRTAHGGVPLRDFRSYDPGRYYWAAAWAQLLGDGILALRLSTAVFQACGLFCGLLAARRTVKSRWGLALAGVLLLVWMSPRHKLFEPAMTMAAVLVGVRLLERPSLRRCFGAGVLVGLAGILGKNHGLYCAAAMLSLLLFVHFRIAPARLAPRELARRLLAWGVGVAAGFSPLLALLPVRGFFASYVESFRFFLLQGKTNYPEPFPWPWLELRARLDSGGGRLDGIGRLELTAFGVILLLVPVFLVTAAVFMAGADRENLKRRALLIASGTVGLFYAHHMYSRTDFFHLTQSLHPILLGVIALPAAVARRRLAVAWLVPALAAATLLTAVPQMPLFHRLTAPPDAPFVPFNLAGDEIYLPAHQADVLTTVRWNLDSRVPKGEPILFAAHLPGYYPAFGRPSPVWDSYPMWPGIGGLDERMLAELQAKNVRWALIATYPMPGSEELRFQNSYPKVWDYLMENFDHVRTPGMPHRLRLFHRL